MCRKLATARLRFFLVSIDLAFDLNFRAGILVYGLSSTSKHFF